jgi:hypothetical protein
VNAGLLKIVTTDLTKIEIAKKHASNDFEIIGAIARRRFRELTKETIGVELPMISAGGPDYFDEHSDSLELWSPGSPCFPMPEVEAMQQELTGISISTLLK